MWGRQMEVVAGGMTFRYPELRIDFDQSFDMDSVPLVTDIKIYNLSNNTIAALLSEKNVVVNAGYKDTGMTCVAKGELRQAFTHFNNQDKVTVLRILNANPTINNTLVKTYTKNTLIQDVLRDLLSVADVSVSTSEVPPVRLTKALVVKGKRIDIINNLCKEYGIKLNIDTLGIAKLGATLQGDEAGYLLKASTGLIGSPVPSIDEEGYVKYEVKSMFLAGVKSLSKLRVESKTLTGNVQVISGKHTLDRDDWVTQLEVETLA